MLQGRGRERIDVSRHDGCRLLTSRTNRRFVVFAPRVGQSSPREMPLLV
jgi:hypothetical protein